MARPVKLVRISLGVLVLGGLTLDAQQQPTFRSTTALVQVDAIALNRAGDFVRGLGPDDLVLYENGKAQKIEQFYMVTHDPTRPAASGNAGLPNADRAHRVFVIVFDEGHLAHDSVQRVKVGAEHFLREQFGPGDLGGVFVNGSLFRGRLTSSRTELINGVQAVKPEIDNRQALLAPFREFPRQMAADHAHERRLVQRRTHRQRFEKRRRLELLDNQ